ncbi:hypothetical protein HJC23_005811 [Cyclotella cryptica]|uniref:Isopenicillin N synthase-like Fe(2+) 2OG dioxygenase domain-containing protein n=1 Tax=Cyclotella cryptica TaxID=29204 RepID=A0ABD3QZN6_9STRA|eukprot:CCRYP_000310-RA/>CCRYP_000310-RA protein AED:0.01 eAED:0.00 QI:0/-1/0/1/-1/1/1/0/478
MKSRRCTCAPHPRIDLTDAYFKYHGKIASHDKSSVGDESSTACDGNTFDDVRTQIQSACQSHGCFHVSIRYPSVSAENNASYLPIGCLAKSRHDVERSIELLFSPQFLKQSLPNVNSLEWGDICDNGTLETVFRDGSSHFKCGTFRGRSAESGDEGQRKPEPKLSWEFQRCSSTKQPLDTTSLEISDTHLEWRVLPEWTEALHSVAATVIHLLGIPPGLVLREQPCECSQSPTNESPSGRQCHCNIDLLRVFRYDALDITDSSLGSSAHSDWGTVTVVWQDDKGGLQTYCDSCEKWSNVDTSASASRNNHPDNDENNVVVNLFLHVGDFLSLATLQHKAGIPIWHSPRHRVLCPVRSCEDSSSSSSNDSYFNNQCRRSLVYFAYPPPGISLKDAQSGIRHVVSSPVTETACDSLRCHTMKMYSVLHDQSEQIIGVGTKQFNDDEIETVEETTTLAYEHIRDVPFDDVIARKWDQVQRK